MLMALISPSRTTACKTKNYLKSVASKKGVNGTNCKESPTESHTTISGIFSMKYVWRSLRVSNNALPLAIGCQ